MAVTLPSDLVLDVMRNADPVRSREVMARLNQGRDAPDASEDFSAVLSRSAPTRESAPVEMSGGVSLPLLPGETPDPKARAYRSVEQFMLRDMIETMLPSQQSGVFGDQISGGVWRSITADALSSAVTESGGIGLASMFASQEHGGHVARADQWPYFGVQQIHSFIPAVPTSQES